MTNDETLSWHEKLASGCDQVGWARFKTPRNESEQRWIDTIKLNFETNNLEDTMEAKMTYRMASLLAHVPEVTIMQWDST